MKKIARKIFQPNIDTSFLIEELPKEMNCTQNDFINAAIIASITPINKKLNFEASQIFEKIANEEPIKEEELQTILARCVDSLKDNPVEDPTPLIQIFSHFRNPVGGNYRYDYINKVDIYQDDKLHRLNDILKTVDNDYILGKREFGERSLTVFQHWKELAAYSEIYQELAILIECERSYRELSTSRTLYLIWMLDIAIRHSTLSPIREDFETKISLSDRYYGIKYEINIYQTDNGYCDLSGDVEFSQMSDDIKGYFKELADNGGHYVMGEITEEDVERVRKLEAKGRMLFRRLKKKERR